MIESDVGPGWAMGDDFSLAEEALQEAFARAAACWPREGLPQRPAAWLTTVARRCAVDIIRRRRTEEFGAKQLAEMEALAEASEEDPASISGVADERLRLLFTCCHPALAADAPIALTLPQNVESYLTPSAAAGTVR